MDGSDDEDEDDEELGRASVRPQRSSLRMQRVTRSSTLFKYPMKCAGRSPIVSNNDVDESSSEESDDADGTSRSSDLEADSIVDGDSGLEVQNGGRPYCLRPRRTKINHALSPPAEETRPPPQSQPADCGSARELVDAGAVGVVRAKFNYAIPPPIEETRPPPMSRPANRGGARTRRGPGWAEWSRWMGIPADDSVGDPMLCSSVVRQYS